MYPHHLRDTELDKNFSRTQLATVSLVLCSPVVLFIGGTLALVMGGPVAFLSFACTVTALRLVLAFSAARSSLGLLAVLVSLIALACCVIALVATVKEIGDISDCLNGIRCS